MGTTLQTNREHDPITLVCVAVVLLVSLQSASARAQFTSRGQRPPIPNGGGMPYNFNWEVNDPPSENEYHHQQESDGEVTRGEYGVLLPDGRRQLVQFYDDGTGYHATVTYAGQPSTVNRR